MALQVWLPLNRDLRNQGLTNVSITNNSASYDSANCCYILSGNGSLSFPTTNLKFMKMTNTSRMSLSWWAKGSNEDNTWLFATNNWEVHFRTSHISVYQNGVSSECRYNSTTSSTEWRHVAFTWDGPARTLSLYVDGVLAQSRVLASVSTNDLSSTFVLPHSGTYSMWDFRIYDHALSAKEIAEISKGCILHYPCNDILNESTVNYCPYPEKTGDVGAIGWDQSKHVGAITVNGWATGYNSGVTSSSVGYHAFWKIIDNIPTMVFTDRNSSYTTTHRWLGINSNDFGNYYSMSQGTTYTISFDAKSDVNGKCISGGFYYTKQGTTSGSFYDGKFLKYVTTEWQRYSATFTVQYVVEDAWNAFYFYGHEQGGASTNPEATSYVRNVQIEIKDHATVYTQSSRTQTKLKDVSGFDNHSTITGSLPLVTTPKSARYDKCMDLTNGRAIDTINAPQIQSASFWIYIGDSIYSATYAIVFRHISGIAFGFNNGNSVLIHNGDSEIPCYWNITSKVKYNSWNHFAINHYSDNTELFINGTKYTNGTSSRWAKTSNNFELGKGTSTVHFSGLISDFRLFSKILTQADVDDLYKDSFAIDKNQNGFTYELNESDSQSTVGVKKNGQLLCNDYEEGQLLMIKMYWNDDDEEYELDYQDYYAYEGKITTWEGQKCYIWQRYDADCEAYDYEDTDNSENIILTNTLNIKMPFNGSSPEFVAAIGLDGEECYNEPRLAMWTRLDSDGEYTGMIKLEGVTNSNEVARICKSGKVTTREIHEI